MIGRAIGRTLERKLDSRQMMAICTGTGAPHFLAEAYTGSRQCGRWSKMAQMSS